MMPFHKISILEFGGLPMPSTKARSSEQELHELELLLEADPSAKEFYVDFLNINAEIRGC